MPSDRHSKLVEVFSAAADLHGKRRLAYLDKACGDDADLRAEVEALLRRDEQKAVLDTPALDGGARVILEHTAETSAQLPKEIGPYSILEVLGEGGMGTVYKARQANPARLVALKIIRSGLPTRSLVRRFQYEAQILGRLQHPAIAQVHEAGHATDGNRQVPFIAMELVNGVALDEYVQYQHLGLREKLQLFQRLAQGVHYAHCNGVIHRDLKPSNVLVDSGGNPKILDFGLAKLTDSDVAAVTVDTDYGRIQGTLAYMSPEQARGDPHKIDLLTDVYSLGIILYELVTGQAPYDINQRSLPDALSAICDEPPRRPASLVRSVPKDLEIIILKTIEKDPSRRYQSAAELASDIDRFLNQQPITARPASTLYQLRKLVARHKVPVASLVVLFASLAIFAAWMAVMYRDAERLRVTAEMARESEVRHREEAERAAETAERTSEFLQNLLASVSPEHAQGRDVSVLREVLEDAAQRVDVELRDQPLVAAAVNFTIGRTYAALGDHAAAEPFLKNSIELSEGELGPKHHSTLTSMNEYALCLVAQGRYEPAEQSLTQVLEARRRILGGEHPDTLSSINNLGLLYDTIARYDDAEPLYIEALTLRRQILGDDHEDTLTSINNFALLCEARKRYDQAEQLYVEALETRMRILGELHPKALVSMNNLGLFYSNRGRLDDAQPFLERTLQLREQVLGETHPQTIHSMNNLALLRQRQGDLDGAEQYCRRALEAARTSLGPSHLETAKFACNLAAHYRKRGRLAEAEPLYHECVRIRQTALGSDDPATLKAMNSLALLLESAKRYAEAVALYKTVLEGRRRTLGDRHRDTLLTIHSVGTTYEAMEEWTDAEKYHREAAAGAREVFTKSRRLLGIFLSHWGHALAQLGRADEARSILKEGYRVLQSAMGEENKYTQQARARLEAVDGP